MRKTFLALLVILCLPALAWAHGDQPDILRASIRCGGTEFRAVTRDLTVAGALNHGKIGQSISARTSGTTSAWSVELREPSFFLHSVLPGTRLLELFVSSWQCRKTPTGKVLVLWYNCQIDIPDAPSEDGCEGHNGWERYISTQGEMLDPGFSFEDPRYFPLRMRLGYQGPSSQPDRGEGIFRVIAAKPEFFRNDIQCGGTRFSAQTRYLDRARIGQAMQAFPHGSEARTVDLREPSFVMRRYMPGTRILAAPVTAWQCLKTQTGHILELWYSCAYLDEDPPQQYCSVANEWKRYISTEGGLLDRGYAVDDPRYGALLARLGYQGDPADQRRDDGPSASIP